MGKFYWLKLKKDFFKRHDMINLRALENGLTYEAIFIHLMTEAIDHDGFLRYSEKKPYTARTLAPLATTDEKTMKLAMEIFEDLELIDILEDGTIFVPLSIANIGSETDNPSANRQRRYRERNASVTKNNDSVTKSNETVTHIVTNRNESIEKEKDIELDIEKEIEKDIEEEESSSAMPDFEEVENFAKEKNLSVNAFAFYEYYKAREWKANGKFIKDWKSLLIKWDNTTPKDPREEYEKLFGKRCNI